MTQKKTAGQWITDRWNAVLDFIQHSAEPALFIMVMFQIATILPFPDLLPKDAQAAVTQTVQTIDSLVLLCQQFVLDIAGASLVKRSMHDHPGKNVLFYLGCFLVTTTICSVLLAMLKSISWISADSQKYIEDGLILVRMILAVLYGCLVDDSFHTTIQATAQTAQASVQATVQGLHISKSVQLSNFVNLTTQTSDTVQEPEVDTTQTSDTVQEPEVDTTQTSDTVQEPEVDTTQTSDTVQEPEVDTTQTSDTVQGITKGHLTLIAQTEHVQEQKKEQNTEPLQTVQKKKRKTEMWGIEQERILDAVLSINPDCTARALAEQLHCSPTTANTKKKDWLKRQTAQTEPVQEQKSVQEQPKLDMIELQMYNLLMQNPSTLHDLEAFAAGHTMDELVQELQQRYPEYKNYIKKERIERVMHSIQAEKQAEDGIQVDCTSLVEI